MGLFSSVSRFFWRLRESFCLGCHLVFQQTAKARCKAHRARIFSGGCMVAGQRAALCLGARASGPHAGGTPAFPGALAAGRAVLIRVGVWPLMELAL